MFVTATEAKTHLGRYLKQLNEKEEPIYIVRHEKVVAVLTAYEESDEETLSVSDKSLE